MNFFGSRDIKHYIAQLLPQIVKGETHCLDFPCGNGETLKILKEQGANVYGADLFPELCRVRDVTVKKADLSHTFPFEDESMDLSICQEGIEHVGNQNFVFNEFSRILKPGGKLILTTPNYSKIKSRLSYLLTESESFNRIMPPNEVESIWLNTSEDDRLYFGHVFLTGITRLRLFGKLAGFELKKVHDTKVNHTSLLYFPLLYPLIWLSSFRTYRRFVRKKGNKDLAWEIFKIMTSPKILLENHLLLEFEKVENSQQAIQKIKAKGHFDMQT